MAAGKGTRLKSQHPKVLHKIGGKALLEHVIGTAAQVVAPSDIFVIVGHEAERVTHSVRDAGVNFVVQAEQRGTGHAIKSAQQALSGYDHVLVLSGDVPLIRPQTLERLRDFHLARGAAMAVLTALAPDPHGYGRVVRRQRNSDQIAAIVEQKMLKPGQEKIREINSGIYAFSAAALFGVIDQLTTNNPAGEYYLTDVAGLLTARNHAVLALEAAEPVEVLGVNSRAELARLDAALRSAKCNLLMASGVTIYQPETVVIDADVTVGQDTVIEPFVQLLGRTTVGRDCRIRSYSVLTNVELGDEVEIKPGCVITDSRAERGAVLGPFSHLRPGSNVGEGAHLGAFVETKKIRMGRGSKANHLTYLGDAEIGAGVNVGAGTITCNYDGSHKHTTVIEDHVFVGSDTTLVAPVTIGRGAYIGAASCITEDVPEDSLALGRARQTVKPGWVRERRAAAAKPKP
ncbi:MAG TPA: bifunctional UDP-N-acetylglucosamine diphosphorylase/glucosamine-1-phosphate N-acetyltransferase GlmU [Terriglobales bacterium]|nr:bifunctional UDP-N-acetylglucosamine diphosphorylase/glucosamine-1-phosphate N-acetyltransferase GlmU [Terriglobales bacterium]